MHIILAVLSIFAGLSILALPLLTAFIPRLGLSPLHLSHSRPVRDAQITLVWLGAAASLWVRPSIWGLAAVLLAPVFSFLARRLFPKTVLVALERPRHARIGLASPTPVLAVQHNQETMAYPLELILTHPVINDGIGGLPVVATWCVVSRSGRVYSADVDDHILTFEVFGFWRKNLLLRDRETGTIWQQATGEAIDGPLAGSRLKAFFAQEMTWEALTALAPASAFARPPASPGAHTGRLIPVGWLNRLLPLATRLHLPGLSAVDRRLDPHAVVAGVVVAGEAKAYPLAILQSRQVTHDRLGGQDIHVAYLPAEARIVVQGEDSQVLPHQRQWWLAWSEFHPGCAIYSLDDKTS